MKCFKKIICLALICVLAVNCVPNISKAAISESPKKQAYWSLYYNPTLSSSENLKKDSKTFVTHRSTLKHKIDHIATETTVGVQVLNANKSEHVFDHSSADASYDYDLEIGYSYTEAVRLISYVNKLTTASGHVYV